MDNKEELRRAWAARLVEFKDSGLSVSAWCARHDIKISQMRYWLRRDRESQPVEWLPLTDDPGHALTVRVGHVSIEVHSGFDPKLLQAVVKTLTALC